MKSFVLFLLTLFLGLTLPAQQYSLYGPAKFLTWNNQARSSGMGELGVVSPDGYAGVAIWQNPALLGSHDHQQAASLNFSPMLRALGIPGINMYAGDYYRKFGPNTTLGAAVLYCPYGTFLRDDWWTGFETPSPEFQVKASLSHQLSEHWAIGGGLGYVFSQQVILFADPEQVAYASVTGDIGIHYNQSRQINERNQTYFQWGFSVMNIGQKGSYKGYDPDRYFFPSSLQTGLLWGLKRKTLKGNQWHFSGGVQVKKLLIPWEEENQEFSALPGMFASLLEAQNGIEGNSWEEWTKQMGAEAMFQSKLWLFALRTGIWKEWGFPAYQTFGMSIGTHYFGKSWLRFDWAYYMPYRRNDPFQHTAKLSLSYVRGI
jgi:hypothetical protein